MEALTRVLTRGNEHYGKVEVVGKPELQAARLGDGWDGSDEPA